MSDELVFNRMKELEVSSIISSDFDESEEIN